MGQDSSKVGWYLVKVVLGQFGEDDGLSIVQIISMICCDVFDWGRRSYRPFIADVLPDVAISFFVCSLIILF